MSDPAREALVHMRDESERNATSAIGAIVRYVTGGLPPNHACVLAERRRHAHAMQDFATAQCALRELDVVDGEQ
jgi:hypothetical protein